MTMWHCVVTIVTNVTIVTTQCDTVTLTHCDNGQNEKWSKWKVLKMKSGQNEKCPKWKVVTCGQNEKRVKWKVVTSGQNEKWLKWKVVASGKNGK